METIYMTAISPPKGAEGDLVKLRESLSYTRAWNSPLPGAAPLHLFSLPFPRDRVNTRALKDLPPLTLTGPVVTNGNVILEMDNDEAFFAPEKVFRTIHGKGIPVPAENTFLNWKGVLLAPRHSLPGDEPDVDSTGGVRFHYRTWQLGLYKIRFDRSRLWWEDFSWTCLWLVRKPSS